MLVFWRQGLVFLATPKTASTAIESALSSMAAMIVSRPPQLKHTNVQKYQRQIAPYLGDPKGEKFVTCAVMREPVDWLGSWYRYRLRPEETPEKTTRGRSFDDFVHAYCQADRPEYANIGAQANFLTPDGFRPVDFIFRYDRMDLFVAFLERRLGTTITLPIENVSPQGVTPLSPAAKATLHAHAHRDFALYARLDG